MPDRYVLILAGGRGERFWPWSRPERPKQLLPLARGGRTLLRATLERALLLVPPGHVVVLTAADLKESVARECAGADVRVLAEPVARNTAAAIGAAAALFRSAGADPAFAVLPSDHAIDDLERFRADFTRAFERAERDPVLITFGIRPAGPDTNFGYIHRGKRLDDGVYEVDAFTEKPDAERAARWVASGEYGWNSGMFVWRGSVLMDAMERTRPALARPLRGLSAAGDAEFERRLAEVFPGLESISVDYAVLEHAPNRVVIEATFDWDDLGSWGAWARRQPRDPNGNVLFGKATAVDCERCVVVGEGGVAAAMGLSDMVVVHAGGATLTCRLSDSDRVRRVTEAVRRWAP